MDCTSFFLMIEAILCGDGPAFCHPARLQRSITHEKWPDTQGQNPDLLIQIKLNQAEHHGNSDRAQLVCHGAAINTQRVIFFHESLAQQLLWRGLLKWVGPILSASKNPEWYIVCALPRPRCLHDQIKVFDILFYMDGGGTFHSAPNSLLLRIFWDYTHNSRSFGWVVHSLVDWYLKPQEIFFPDPLWLVKVSNPSIAAVVLSCSQTVCMETLAISWESSVHISWEWNISGTFTPVCIEYWMPGCRRIPAGKGRPLRCSATWSLIVRQRFCKSGTNINVSSNGTTKHPVCQEESITWDVCIFVQPCKNMIFLWSHRIT